MGKCVAVICREQAANENFIVRLKCYRNDFLVCSSSGREGLVHSSICLEPGDIPSQCSPGHCKLSCNDHFSIGLFGYGSDDSERCKPRREGGINCLRKGKVRNKHQKE